MNGSGRPSDQKCRPLPSEWTSAVKSAALRAISLAHYALLEACGRINPNSATVARLHAEILQLREQMRIKDARMARIEPPRRPHYAPIERLAILEMRAACGWSLERTAREFLVTVSIAA